MVYTSLRGRGGTPEGLANRLLSRTHSSLLQQGHKMHVPPRWKKPLLSPKCKPQTCILHAHNQAKGRFIPRTGGAALTDSGVGLLDMLAPLRAQANQVPMPKEARGVVVEK